jgi:hypothetical protein
MFDRLLFVNSHIIFLLLAICKIIAISGGATTQYSIAVHTSIFIGLIPKKFNNAPSNTETIMTK